MGQVPIPGLLYNGRQASYDDGAVQAPPPTTSTPPPATTAPPASSGGATAGAGANSVLYNSVKTSSDDNFYLGKKLYDYRQDLKSLPGSQQLYFDILTNSNGNRYSDASPTKPGYQKDQSMKQYIDKLINDASYNGQQFDATKYTGNLVAVYNQLVADKLAGLIPSPI